MAKSTAEKTYDEIKRQILSGTLRPAERLVEIALAESLQSSRHNVRTALERLHNDGLVEIEANKGARVSALNIEEVVDLYTAREGLEAEVMRLAVANITDEKVKELKACLRDMNRAFADHRFEEYSRLNQVFHGIVYAASGNDTLPEMIEQIRLRLARLNMRVILLPGRGDSSFGEHTAIYEALAARDEKKAVRAIRKHISAVRADVENGWNIVRI